MKVATIVSLLAFAFSSVSAGVLQDIRSRRGCGNDISASKKSLMESDFDAQLESLGLMRNIPVSSFAGPTNVPVWFHVINKGAGVSNGNLTQATIDAQVKVLTDTYAGNYIFSLAGVTYTTSADWFNNAGPDSSK
jgi:hypothetical protein